MFIGQRLSTDYCAVHAVGMFLSLKGLPHSRAQVHRLFGTRRAGWTPPDEAGVAEALRQILGPDAVRHRRVRIGSAAAKACILQQTCARGPVLVSALCRLVADEKIRCRHAFLAIDVDEREARLLDSLGPHPPKGQSWNARLVFNGESRTVLETIGTCWKLDLSGPISFFTAATS